MVAIFWICHDFTITLYEAISFLLFYVLYVSVVIYQSRAKSPITSSNTITGRPNPAVDSEGLFSDPASLVAAVSYELIDSDSKHGEGSDSGAGHVGLPGVSWQPGLSLPERVR